MAKMRYETTLGSDPAATGAVTDIDILWTDAGPVLYATCRVSGTITAYDLSDGSTIDSQAVSGQASDMGALELELIDTGTAGQIGTYKVLSDGDLALVRKPVAPTGQPSDISALVSVSEGGQGWLVLASALEDTLQCYKVTGDGSLKQVDSIGAVDGLGINSPSTLASVTLDGQTFVLAGAAGSSSLSVIAMDDGAMTATDHVVDSLDTRFQGIGAMATAVAGARAYVVVAGGDDGLTLMSLLPTVRMRGSDPRPPQRDAFRAWSRQPETMISAPSCGASLRKAEWTIAGSRN